MKRCDLRIAYSTVSNTECESACVLHGTGGGGPAMLLVQFEAIQFGTGGPLDARTHCIESMLKGIDIAGDCSIGSLRSRDS